MAISRRLFLYGAGASFLMPRHVAIAQESEKTNGTAIFAACRKEENGTYSAAIFNSFGEDIVAVPLPARGHDAVVRPGSTECVVFARRPGNFAVVINPDASPKPYWFSTNPGRHLYGHGVFSADGKRLHTTENDFENGHGVIGIKDATNGYKHIGEFALNGVGPHDIALLSDGRTAAIAVGGILTHPETGRIKLNLSQMTPSLTYLDLETGDVIEQILLAPDLHKLSIRHLAIAKNDTVVFGCQYEGPALHLPPLIGLHQRGKDPLLLRAPAQIHSRMKNYVGSVAVDSSGDIVAASSPRGDIVTYWTVSAEKYLGHREMTDGCGLARSSTSGEFMHTSGTGHSKLANMNETTGPKFNESATNIAWDNHAIFVR